MYARANSSVQGEHQHGHTDRLSDFGELERRVRLLLRELRGRLDEEPVAGCVAKGASLDLENSPSSPCDMAIKMGLALWGYYGLWMA